MGFGAEWPEEARRALFTVGNAVLLLIVVAVAVRQRSSGLAAAGTALFVRGGLAPSAALVASAQKAEDQATASLIRSRN